MPKKERKNEEQFTIRITAAQHSTEHGRGGSRGLHSTAQQALDLSH